MENKILAEKSFLPLVIFLLFTAIAVACVVVCFFAYYYMLVVMAVVMFVFAATMLFFHLRAPRVFAEIVDGKIILRPSRGKEVVLLPGDIINVSVRRSHNAVTMGAIIVSTVDNDYNLHFVKNVFDAEREFLAIMKSEILKRNGFKDGQDTGNTDNRF